MIARAGMGTHDDEYGRWVWGKRTTSVRCFGIYVSLLSGGGWVDAGRVIRGRNGRRTGRVGLIGGQEQAWNFSSTGSSNLVWCTWEWAVSCGGILSFLYVCGQR